MSSPHPQELVNPGQYDDESGMLDELTSLQIWVDDSKVNFCFRFVVWNHEGPLEREPCRINKSCTDTSPGGHVMQTFAYETNIFEDEGKLSFVRDHIFDPNSPSSFKKIYHRSSNVRAIIL